MFTNSSRVSNNQILPPRIFKVPARVIIPVIGSTKRMPRMPAYSPAGAVPNTASRNRPGPMPLPEKPSPPPVGPES